MDKSLIKPLDGFMAIPQVVTVLGISRARVHQLIDEDKFFIDDLRTVGDKRMVVIKNDAVYNQLKKQQERAQRLADDKTGEALRRGANITGELRASDEPMDAVTANEIARDQLAARESLSVFED